MVYLDLGVTDISVINELTQLIRLDFAESSDSIDFDVFHSWDFLNKLYLQLNDSFTCEDLQSVRTSLEETDVTSNLECDAG